MKSDTKLTFHTQRLELTHTWTLARGSCDYRDNVLVRLEKDGIVGYGEAAPLTRYNETAETTTAALQLAVPIFASENLFAFREVKKRWMLNWAMQTRPVLPWISRSWTG